MRQCQTLFSNQGKVNQCIEYRAEHRVFLRKLDSLTTASVSKIFEKLDNIELGQFIHLSLRFSFKYTYSFNYFFWKYTEDRKHK